MQCTFSSPIRVVSAVKLVAIKTKLYWLRFGSGYRAVPKLIVLISDDLSSIVLTVIIS